MFHAHVRVDTFAPNVSDTWRRWPAKRGLGSKFQTFSFICRSVPVRKSMGVYRSIRFQIYAEVRHRAPQLCPFVDIYVTAPRGSFRVRSRLSGRRTCRAGRLIIFLDTADVITNPIRLRVCKYTTDQPFRSYSYADQKEEDSQWDGGGVGEYYYSPGSSSDAQQLKTTYPVQQEVDEDNEEV